MKTRYLRSNMCRISPYAFEKRRDHFIKPTDGILCQEKDDPSTQQDPLAAFLSNSNPNGMTDQMKQQIFHLVSNMFFFTWIDRFFAGFISAKLPFGLTQGFKTMFQSGIDLQDLNVSYVSSLSWYILITSGIQGIISVVLGADAGKVNEAELMKRQLNLVQIQSDSPIKLFKTESENLNILSHQWDLENTENRLLNLFQKNKLQ